ncbi:hypothetical protein JOB18_044365 [Solea senegalensis]|uniref:Uncharacterized protein n=1 Tax=Solea senegalensis TaxID=28829 RepID=A0AAV6TBX5_SOLSE|nr:hypothetical protein JOB18_044365 [Solea senegalensis]
MSAYSGVTPKLQNWLTSQVHYGAGTGFQMLNGLDKDDEKRGCGEEAVESKSSTEYPRGGHAAISSPCSAMFLDLCYSAVLPPPKALWVIVNVAISLAPLCGQLIAAPRPPMRFDSTLFGRGVVKQ